MDRRLSYINFCIFKFLLSTDIPFIVIFFSSTSFCSNYITTSAGHIHVDNVLFVTVAVEERNDYFTNCSNTDLK